MLPVACPLGLKMVPKICKMTIIKPEMPQELLPKVAFQTSKMAFPTPKMALKPPRWPLQPLKMALELPFSLQSQQPKTIRKHMENQ